MFGDRLWWQVALPARAAAARHLRRPLILLCLLAVVGCSGSGEPERFGFKGNVSVDGKPAHRVIVQLTHLDPSVGERERYVSSKTDEAGEFVFGNHADGTSSGFQGGVAGTYAVTFNWLSTDGLDAVDKLNGVYADASQSSFRVSLPVNPNDAPVSFDIKSQP